jgi:hypothetical protein
VIDGVGEDMAIVGTTMRRERCWVDITRRKLLYNMHGQKGVIGGQAAQPKCRGGRFLIRAGVEQ